MSPVFKEVVMHVKHLPDNVLLQIGRSNRRARKKHASHPTRKPLQNVPPCLTFCFRPFPPFPPLGKASFAPPSSSLTPPANPAPPCLSSFNPSFNPARMSPWLGPSEATSFSLTQPAALVSNAAPAPRRLAAAWPPNPKNDSRGTDRRAPVCIPCRACISLCCSSVLQKKSGCGSGCFPPFPFAVCLSTVILAAEVLGSSCVSSFAKGVSKFCRESSKACTQCKKSHLHLKSDT